MNLIRSGDNMEDLSILFVYNSRASIASQSGMLVEG